MTIETIFYRFRVRGGSAAALAALNEVPLARELIFEIDTLKAKLGDGATAYNALPYVPFGGSGGGDLVDIGFDPEVSGLAAANAQVALDAALLAPKEVYLQIYSPGTSVTTITNGAIWLTPEPGVITEVIAVVSTPSTSGSTRIDGRRDGVSIFVTKPSIDATEQSTLTGVTGSLRVAERFFDRGMLYRFDVDAVGTGATGLTVIVRYVPYSLYRDPGGEHLGITWSQSSAYGGLAATAINMRDGNYATGAGTNQVAGQRSWIRADLGSVKPVNRIVIAGGSIGGWGGVATYINGTSKLQGSVDGVTWTDLADVTGVTDSAPQEREFSFTQSSYRYVQLISLFNSAWLATTEFKVYGPAA